MRDVIFMVAPVAIAIYFLVYPDEFHALVAWAMQFIR
jgi:hypothetical protein